MEKDTYYYRKNVPYRIGVREDVRDSVGQVLDDENPWVGVRADGHRKFLQANKYAIQNGLIIEIDEPPLDYRSPNSLTDDEALELVKNFHELRRRLPEFTAEAPVIKLLDAAKKTNRKEATVKLIMERYEEVSPSVMQGAS